MERLSFSFQCGIACPGKGLEACLPCGKICQFCLLFPVRTTLLSGLSLNNFCYSYLITAFPEKINTLEIIAYGKLSLKLILQTG
jgi:hypothetical protein